MAENIIPTQEERSAHFATLPPLTDVAHAQTSALFDVLTLLHIAIDEAHASRFESECLSDVSGLTDRHSRFVSLLGMSKDRVADVIKKFDPYI